MGESLTAGQIEKVVTEEVPVIAQMLGDETAAVNLTIEDIISKGMSQQMVEEVNIITDSIREVHNKIIHPPYDPLKLALLLEMNTRLMRGCHLRARNTVGLGWSIGPVDRDDDDEKVNQAEYKKQRQALKNIYNNPNPASTAADKMFSTPLDFSETSYRMKVDEEATGTGYYEITRNNAGEIDGIYNIPAHTIRVLKDGGFVQLRGQKRKYFKSFGNTLPISALTGEVGKNLKPEARATELLPNMIYSSRSSFYGIPRWISATAAVQGSRLSSIRNIAFFENDAVGRLAIVVSGGALTAQSVNDIRTFVNREGKGPEKAHRVMVLQAEPRKVVTSRNLGTKIDIVPLTVGIDEDASFLGYRRANDEEVREAIGLASPFYTSEGVNRASANVLRRVTIDQDLVPDLNSHQHVLNRTVSINILTTPLTEKERAKFRMQAEFKYTPPASIDELEEAQIQGMYARAGLVTINEARKALGLPALPPEFVYGSTPLPLAMQLLDMGLMYQGAITEDGVLSWEETLENIEASQLQEEVAQADAQARKNATRKTTDSETPQQRIFKRLNDAQREKIRQLTGIAWKLKDFLRQSMGRDLLSAEVVLHDKNGNVVNQTALGDFGGEEAPDE